MSVSRAVQFDYPVADCIDLLFPFSNAGSVNIFLLLGSTTSHEDCQTQFQTCFPFTTPHVVDVYIDREPTGVYPVSCVFAVA